MGGLTPLPGLLSWYENILNIDVVILIFLNQRKNSYLPIKIVVRAKFQISLGPNIQTINTSVRCSKNDLTIAAEKLWQPHKNHEIFGIWFNAGL